MNRKQLKTALKNVYPVTASAREKDFLRKNEQREAKLAEAVLLEMRYMSARYILMAVATTLLLCLVAVSKDPQSVWNVSGALPAVALLVLSALGRSERYEMQEMEAACRFSLKFVRSARMLVLGMASLILLSAAALVLHGRMNERPAATLGLIGVPYMLNVWGNLLITRKWHAKESLLGCLSFTALSCLLPQMLSDAVRLHTLEPRLLALLLIPLTAGTVKEGLMYIKESEELKWNLC